MAPGVVNVVLALHPEPGRLEQIRDRCPERRPPPVTHVQRPRRRSRYELDLNSGSVTDPGAAVAFGIGKDVDNELVVRARGEKEVNEPGAGNLRFHHVLGSRQPCEDALGNIARLSPGGLREGERDRACKVAVGGVARVFQGHLGRGGDRELSILAQLVNGGGQHGSEL